MYSYTWDTETNGFLLNPSPLKFSKEPRPVYYQELDNFGFDQYWNYEKDDSYPYMWAEAGTYWYKGRKVAHVKGGSFYKKPELQIFEEPEPNNGTLEFVNIEVMVKKNKDLMDSLVQETIKNVYNNYKKYYNKVDVFYVAFSGGKDSVVALDIVQKALPHEDLKVLFGDTGMEFPDTYNLVDEIEQECKSKGIDFIRASSGLDPQDTWREFGPPATSNRWCCSVHKSAPQILKLREVLHKKDFRGMAFTGIRADESLMRSEYDEVTFGKKIKGQFSCHAILRWNSAELFNYIYQEGLLLNEAYKKGNNRAGCLVCPMSSGRHEYLKRLCYKKEVDALLDTIRETSAKKTKFTEEQMNEFIDEGNWKSRKSGRELNFGYDKHVAGKDMKNTVLVNALQDSWKEWAKTIGDFIELSPESYTINFREKTYQISLSKQSNGYLFTIENLNNSRNDIKFFSLFKSVVIKSTYCVHCRVCVAECPYGCIKMDRNHVKISDQCRHCYQCHDIMAHCLRYNSIRNRIGADNTMKKLGRFYSFGFKKEWLDTYIKYEGSDEFWDTDGDGQIGNKKKDAFLNFLKDSGMVKQNRKIGHDKYTRYELTPFGKKIIALEGNDNLIWSLILANLVYMPDFNWYVKTVNKGDTLSPDSLKILLNDVMENDKSGRGKANEVSMFKNVLTSTPLGEDIGLGVCDVTKTGNGVKLNSFTRTDWKNLEPLVILYSLYKFAEACEGYYAFTLNRLYNFSAESEGVSPAQIYGIDKEVMKKCLIGLSNNYPDFINVSFTLNLDNISLRDDKTSEDILNLFE